MSLPSPRPLPAATVRSIVLTPRPPYDFAWTLAWLRTSSSAVLEQVDADDTYRRALRLAGRDVLLVMRSTGTIDAPRLLLEVHGDDIDAATLAAAATHIRRVFLLDADAAPFHAVVRRDPTLDVLVQRLPGARPQVLAGPYEATLWAIIGQQVNVTFARALKGRLVDLCGRRLTVGEASYPLLPFPEDVAALDPALLRAHQFSRQKIAYLIAVSEAVASGDLDFAALAALPQEEAIAALTRHKGIGRWTAEYILMRGLGDPDSLPAADMGLRAILGRSHTLGRNASEAEVRAYAEPWAPWRGWATWYWWLALQTRAEL
jgi:DNA-3-methyladenine glycosylase II